MLSATLVFLLHPGEREPRRGEQVVADPGDRIYAREPVELIVVQADTAVACKNEVHDPGLQPPHARVLEAPDRIAREPKQGPVDHRADRLL